MSLFAILLENGHIVQLPGRKDRARATMRRWKEARRKAIAEGALAQPRLALGLVCWKKHQ